MMVRRQYVKFKWAVLWTQCNMLDGLTEHFCLYDWKQPGRGLMLFDTKKEAVIYREEHYGYIARRDDLRVEPHCWNPPKIVKVFVHIGEVDARKLPKRYQRTLDQRRREKRRTRKG